MNPLLVRRIILALGALLLFCATPSTFQEWRRHQQAKVEYAQRLEHRRSEQQQRNKAMAQEWTAIDANRLVEAEAKEENAKMASYIVIGAGDADYNGVYIEESLYNGQPYYKLGASHFLLWNGTNWNLSDMLVDDGLFYAGGANPLDPTDGEWFVHDGGVPPVPTVTSDNADTLAPEVASAVIAAVGNLLTTNWPEAGSPLVVGTAGLSGEPDTWRDYAIACRYHRTYCRGYFARDL